MNTPKFTSKPTVSGYYWCNQFNEIQVPFVCFFDSHKDCDENSRVTLPSGDRVALEYKGFRDPVFFGPLVPPNFKLDNLIG